ncbi:hypothetical protein EI427_04770 [Flammeovirga pectinis]|uniref:Lipoprotein n=1 Tax=Flammeovirga pectinis TaxID=2494373 RepID=A0A3S9P050_9BACT|nr:hypothetical protein [Flammeovirga pectinis]AZQ61565.1 hypothetical protein EI427_04770 [Flammeovirga pectinis]
MTLKNLFIYIISFIFCSCTSTIEDPKYTLGTMYYPIEEGWYITYTIDTTFIDFDDQNADKDGVVNISSIQLKEFISSPYDDGFGGQNFKLDRYKRLDESMEWELDSVWALAYRKGQVIKYENGIPYIKIVNPLEDRMKWNQNAYNNQGATSSSGFDLRYEVASVGRVYVFGSQTYSPTAVINEVDQENDITNSSVKLVSVYAKDIGLVYKEYKLSKKRYYQAKSSDATLTGNPYCGNNENSELITLGNGQRVVNPFFEQDVCEENPIYNVSADSIERWIARWEDGVNNAVVDWETQSNGVDTVYVVSMYHPDYKNGYNEVGTEIKQSIIEYGIAFPTE